ncbi:deaminase [Gordonia jinghuaiqii]|uniref:Dihydrofolate reductase family protein n=1 Tax=Gordonia jinghuaiqii TaxID=2758710 RepID=A0A7D7R0L1_9ACTN|nr:deaminase [Gordonia jinghuaiqii]QMT03948.1 dihydrofolate reductase family protein [Gordonia jinghuaiqii]
MVVACWNRPWTRRSTRADAYVAARDEFPAMAGSVPPTVVLAHNPPAEPVEGVTFATDLRQAVELAAERAGESYVTVIGADVARQMIEHGMLDEVLVFYVPVFLGDGIRLFDRPGGDEVRLTPISGETRYWCRVDRSAVDTARPSSVGSAGLEPATKRL